jgi:hypothetical protein
LFASLINAIRESDEACCERVTVHGLRH